MPRLCTIFAWLLSVACAATAAAQNGLDIGPGGGPARAPWYSPSGLCFQPLLYASPLETTYVTADLIAFRRDWQTRQVFATLNNYDQHRALDRRFGNRLSARTARACRTAFERLVRPSKEASLDLLQWDETRTRLDSTPNSQGTTGNLFSPFSNFGDPAVVGFDFNDLASIRLQFAIQQRRAESAPTTGHAAVADAGLRTLRISLHERPRDVQLSHRVAARRSGPVRPSRSRSTPGTACGDCRPAARSSFASSRGFGSTSSSRAS